MEIDCGERGFWNWMGLVGDLSWAGIVLEGGFPADWSLGAWVTGMAAGRLVGPS